MKIQKNMFLIYFHCFSIVSKKFKFSKILGTRSIFNALFLKSLIFLIELILILFVFRKIQKNKKNQNLQKKKLRDQLET